nr:polysaccharide lyase family protein [Melissococcus plutonius]
MVVLTNEKGDYYNHNAGHIYYAETKKSNHFTMNHVQPDTYYMYAYIRHTGISEEFYLGSYKINKNLNLDKLIVDYKEKPLIWKIGGYSKTTESFKFGDQLRNHIWKDLTPATLNYRIGSKDDWYYLQSNRGEWMIQFKKPKQTAKNYLLTVCLAGTSYQASSEQAGTDIKYTVKLNDTILNTYTFENDRSAYRSSVTGGRTQKLQMKISAEQLIDNNVIHFQTNGYVAYDMIKLEIEE